MKKSWLKQIDWILALITIWGIGFLIDSTIINSDIPDWWKFVWLK